MTPYDDETPTRDRTGDVFVYQRDGSYIHFAPDAFGAISAAFTGAKAFYEGPTFHGARAVVKLSEVNAIVLNTPESIAAAEEDERRARAKRKRYGFLSEDD
jgi:hypothetical protein